MHALLDRALPHHSCSGSTPTRELAGMCGTQRPMLLNSASRRIAGPKQSKALV